MDIKEQNVLSDDVATQFLTMKRNSDVAVKIEIEEQTGVSDFASQNEEDILPENPVMKDEKYNVDHELYNKIEIKEEPWWLETETSSVCDDIKDEDFPPVKSSRLCVEAVSGESPEVSGRNTSFYNVRDHLQCESVKSDVREMSTVQEHVLLEPSEKYGRVEMWSSPLDLTPKVSTHKNKRLYKCNMCAKHFSHLSHLKSHHLIHEGKKPHECKTCDKRFTQLSTLKRHNLIHEGKKPHQCTTCEKRFTQLSDLKQHNLIHEGKKPYECKTCDKRFTQLSTLKRHNLIHDGKKPHQCITCKKRFTQLSDLKKHNLIHEGQKPYQCKSCDKSFIHLVSLKRHLTQGGKKPPKCKTCDKSFSDLAN